MVGQDLREGSRGRRIHVAGQVLYEGGWDHRIVGGDCDGDSYT